MASVNVLEAKTHLSKLVDRIANGQDREIVIARNGRPVARLVPIVNEVPGKRVGLLRGKFKAPSLRRLNARNAEIARLFPANADMRTLLDTHMGLWALLDDRRLGAAARGLINDLGTAIFVSATSID